MAAGALRPMVIPSGARNLSRCSGPPASPAPGALPRARAPTLAGDARVAGAAQAGSPLDPARYRRQRAGNSSPGSGRRRPPSLAGLPSFRDLRKRVGQPVHFGLCGVQVEGGPSRTGDSEPPEQRQRGKITGAHRDPAAVELREHRLRLLPIENEAEDADPIFGPGRAKDPEARHGAEAVERMRDQSLLPPPDRLPAQRVEEADRRGET